MGMFPMKSPLKLQPSAWKTPGKSIHCRQRLRPFGAAVAPECHGPFIDSEYSVLFKLIEIPVRVASRLLEAERAELR